MSEIQEWFRTSIRNPILRAAYVFSKFFNTLLDLKGHKHQFAPELKQLNEIITYSLENRSDISDHLVTLFLESITTYPTPALIVELGVRGGASTFVLERVAGLIGAKLVSVDIEDCSNVSSFSDWTFVQEDDITFASHFEAWCHTRGIKPEIGILFIDTSHTYEHTLKEIQSWFPFLSPHSKVFFHVTNMKPIYFRRDGSIGVTMSSQRGVIAALEAYFRKSFRETADFVDFSREWMIQHYACCSGFTILKRISLNMVQE